jgi:nucleotide-binding universal stress UspA family protein
MYRNILIAVALDHEDVLPRKIAVARHLLDSGGRVTLLTVLENVPGFVSEFVDLKPENHLTARVKERLDKVHDGEGHFLTEVRTGKAGVEISRFAAENGIDLVIVGSHRPGLQDYFLGSTAARVARRAPCAVHIVRSRAGS